MAGTLTMLLDANTFGKSKAAVVLVDLVNAAGDDKLSRRVARFFSQYSQGAHDIAREVKPLGLRRRLLEVWCRVERDKAERAELPVKVKSYLLNLEHALLCDLRRECLAKRKPRDEGWGGVDGKQFGECPDWYGGSDFP